VVGGNSLHSGSSAGVISEKSDISFRLYLGMLYVDLGGNLLGLRFSRVKG
jgi:hypothetical protein